jgi:hypothetical protein
MAKPKVSEQTWQRIMHEQGVEIFESEEHQGDYYKVVVPGKRPKYFYGELAWADYQRYASDNISYAYVV